MILSKQTILSFFPHSHPDPHTHHRPQTHHPHTLTYYHVAKSLGDTSVHGQLVARGLAWAQHINETWKILVYAGAYIIFSVGFDITIIALLGDAVLAIGELWL